MFVVSVNITSLIGSGVVGVFYVKGQERLLITHFCTVNLPGRYGHFKTFFGVQWVMPYYMKNLLLRWYGRKLMADLRTSAKLSLYAYHLEFLI